MLEQLVVSNLCTLHKDCSVFNMTQHMSHTVRFDVWRKNGKSMDINEMLVLSCDAMEVRVMKSTIKHAMRGTGCFARMKLGRRNVVELYNGTMLYRNLYGRQHKDGILGESVLLVSVKDIQNYSVHITEEVSDSLKST